MKTFLHHGRGMKLEFWPPRTLRERRVAVLVGLGMNGHKYGNQIEVGRIGRFSDSSEPRMRYGLLSTSHKGFVSISSPYLTKLGRRMVEDDQLMGQERNMKNFDLICFIRLLYHKNIRRSSRPTSPYPHPNLSVNSVPNHCPNCLIPFTPIHYNTSPTYTKKFINQLLRKTPEKQTN
ncbi:hypothetical protein RND71_025014 [Anisodus tanguticus]|uniref:Uncharacterized protein n=1 Tax=Anisodus tanguticus TaxID=243964 RepID=A0AAE1RS98_9SOLA|nr:hypothetical protein RND71_025014 [Anisodus tanguticus]